MPTVFTRIIDGELPGRFVWRDERCVAFLSINPTADGHTLVVPIEAVDHWIDLDGDLAAHLMRVAQHVGRAQDAALSPSRVGLLVAGFEVPHTHLHVIPMQGMAELDVANATHDPDPATMDRVREQIVTALRDAGHQPGV